MICKRTPVLLLVRSSFYGSFASVNSKQKQIWYDTKENTCTITNTFLILQLHRSFELILIINLYSSETYNFYFVLRLFQQLQWRARIALFTFTKIKNGERRVARYDSAPPLPSLFFWLVTTQPIILVSSSNA